MRQLVVVCLAAVVVLGGAVPAAAQNGPSKCTALKTKAVGVYAQRLAACRSKALAKGVPLDPVCADKAETGLLRAFEKAERKGDCLETGDFDVARDEAAELFARVATVIEAEPICCTTPNVPNCLYVTSEIECFGVGGTVGGAGTACDASGSCVAPPAAAGACCEGLVLQGYEAGTGCITNGPEESCTSGGGQYSASAVCEPTGHCVAP